MSDTRRVTRRPLLPALIAIGLAVVGWNLGAIEEGAYATANAGIAVQGSEGTPGRLADTCGVPAQGAGGGGQRGGAAAPVFPPGQYPVRLPPVSLLGARNDLPNPFSTGRSLGAVTRWEEVGINGRRLYRPGRHHLGH